MNKSETVSSNGVSTIGTDSAVVSVVVVVKLLSSTTAASFVVYVLSPPSVLLSPAVKVAVACSCMVDNKPLSVSPSGVDRVDLATCKLDDDEVLLSAWWWWWSTFNTRRFLRKRNLLLLVFPS